MIKALYALRKGGQTKRFHTEQLIGEQTVAEHSFGVACILTVIEPDCSLELLKAALFHDIAEQATGDCPAPVKWAHPELKDLLNRIEQLFHTQHQHAFSEKLSPHEKLALKWADSLDFLCTCYEQRMLGNLHADEMVKKIILFMANDIQWHNKGYDLMKKIWSEYDAIGK